MPDDKLDTLLARQLLNSTFGLASADNLAQRRLYNITDKLYDTLGIKDYLNKVYGDPMLKFKNGSYISYDIDLTRPYIVMADIINQIKMEEEKNKMADKKEVYTFTTRDFKGNRFEITLEKDFKNTEFPYHARTYTLKDDNDRCFAVTFGYRFWEQLETQLMYDLAYNGIAICKEWRDEVTQELHRAKNVFRGCSYANIDSPYQGGYTTDRSKAKSPFEHMPKIEEVIYNAPATIVKWKDGTKTVVKCQDGEIFDWEKGLAMAYVKRAFGNNRSYYGLFKKNEPDVVLRNSNVRYDPKVAKEVCIIVPKDLPVTSDIITKAHELIMKEGDKKWENGIEVER